MVRAKRVVSGYNQRHARIDSSKLFNDDRIFDITQSGAAQVLRKNSSHHSQLAGFLDHLERKNLSFIPCENVRPDLGLGELPDRLPKLDLLGGILKVHGVILSAFWPVS